MLKFFRNPIERAKVIFFLSVLILAYTQIKIDYKPYGKLSEPVLADSILINGIDEIQQAGFSVIEDENDLNFSKIDSLKSIQSSSK